MNESLGVMDDGIDEDEQRRVCAAAEELCLHGASTPQRAADLESGA